MTVIQVQSQKLDQALNRLIAKTANLQPLFSDWGEYLVREIDNEFRTETAMSGEKWAPLAASTLRAKAKSKRISKIWQSRGITRSTVAYQALPTRLIVGVQTPYARYVNDGTKRMPARPLIPETLPPRVVNELGRIAQSYLS